jgi:hypothetical protein
MESTVTIEVHGDVVDLVAPEFEIRFKSLRAFRLFREWVETARVVGDEPGRPPQTRISEDGGDEWYALASPEGAVALHHFADGEVDITVVVPADRWRAVGHAVLATSAEIR